MLNLPSTQELAPSGGQAVAVAVPLLDGQTQEHIDELIRTASEKQERLQRRDTTIAQLRSELEQAEDARLVANRSPKRNGTRSGRTSLSRAEAQETKEVTKMMATTIGVETIAVVPPAAQVSVKTREARLKRGC